MACWEGLDHTGQLKYIYASSKGEGNRDAFKIFHCGKTETYSIKFPMITSVSTQFSGAKYIHIVVQYERPEFLPSCKN